MNKKIRKTALLVGACTIAGLFWSPQAMADSAVNTAQSVQQGRRVTGTVVDAMGPVIGASVLEKGTNNGTVTDLKDLDELLKGIILPSTEDISVLMKYTDKYATRHKGQK